MKNQIFVVFNKVSERFGEVFASANVATATREFLSRLTVSPVFRREDFILFHCGNVDVESGRFTTLDSPVSVPLVDSPLEFENAVSKEKNNG